MTRGGPRKGAGRPKLPRKQKRVIAVQVRLTEAQKKWVDEAASYRDIPVAHLVYVWLVDKGMPE